MRRTNDFGCAVLLAAILLFISGCVTTADLERLKISRETFNNKINERFQELDDGVISRHDFDIAMRDAKDNYNESVEATIEEAAERTKEMIDGVKSGAINLTQLLVGLTGTGGAAMTGLNLWRNGTRRKDLQAVSKPVQ